MVSQRADAIKLRSWYVCPAAIAIEMEEVWVDKDFGEIESARIVMLKADGGLVSS